MPVEINWTDEEQAEIDVICDACEKRYMILSPDITNLHLCSFCGHYLDLPAGDADEKEEDSWY